MEQLILLINTITLRCDKQNYQGKHSVQKQYSTIVSKNEAVTIKTRKSHSTI